jgi:hypothetical protein
MSDELAAAYRAGNSAVTAAYRHGYEEGRVVGHEEQKRTHHEWLLNADDRLAQVSEEARREALLDAATAWEDGTDLNAFANKHYQPGGPSAAVLAAELLAEGGGPGNSIHSWRCDYPDRYGPCSCVAETANVMSTAVLASDWLADVKREAARAALACVEAARSDAQGGAGGQVHRTDESASDRLNRTSEVPDETAATDDGLDDSLGMALDDLEAAEARLAGLDGEA